MARQSNANGFLLPFFLKSLLPFLESWQYQLSGRWIIKDGHDVKLQGEPLCLGNVMHVAPAKQYMFTGTTPLPGWICANGDGRGLKCSG